MSFFSLLPPDKLRPWEGQDRGGRDKNENEFVEFIFANLYHGCLRTRPLYLNWTVKYYTVWMQIVRNVSLRLSFNFKIHYSL